MCLLWLVITEAVKESQSLEKNVLDESPFPFSLPAGIPLLLLLRDRGYSGQEKVFQASHEFALLPRNNRLLNLSQKKVSQHDTLRGAKLSKNLQWRHSGRILKSVYYNFRLLQKGRMTNEHFQKIAFSLLKSLSSSRTLFLEIGCHDISHPLRSFCIYECKIHHDVAFVLCVSFVHLPLHRYPIFRRKNRLKILFKCLSPGRRRYVSFVMKIHLEYPILM